MPARKVGMDVMSASVESHAAPEGLRPISLARDLKGVAELIELCFGHSLDSSDLAAVREMRAVGSLGPLLWVAGALDTSGLGLGYVWEAGGRVVGNVSTFRAGSGLGQEGPGWLVANVAVHPTQRRRGIARALMEAALDRLAGLGGQWVVLQLEQDNSGARALYDSLGFEEVGRVAQWTLHAGGSGLGQADAQPAGTPVPRLRKRDEWQAELQLAVQDRAGGLTWGRPFERSQFKRGFPGLAWDALTGSLRTRWVLAGESGLAGCLWTDVVSFRNLRLTLLLEPSPGQTATGLRLLRHALAAGRTARRIRLEASERDPALSDALREMGFQQDRILVQMKWRAGRHVGSNVPIGR